jgi:hypothetical protein
VLILQYLDAFYLFVGLSFLIDLAILVLHLLRPIGHVDHDPLKVVHLDLPDLYHRLGVVPLFLLVSQATVMQHGISNSPDVSLGFLEAFQSFLRPLVFLLFENFDEG